MSEQTSTPEQFDPADHTVDQVNAYLADADPAERERVLALEDGDGGKRRATVSREFPAPEGQEPQEGENGAQAGTSEPTEAGPTSTKGQTFAEAAEVIAEHNGPATPVHVTNTDRLHAEGKSKGLTFAEQAALAREQYGTGNPADRER